MSKRVITICILQLFPDQVVTSQILKSTFLIKLFLYMTENSRPKLKYLENKKLLSLRREGAPSNNDGKLPTTRTNYLNVFQQ